MAIFTFKQALQRSGATPEDVKSLGNSPESQEQEQDQSFIQETGSDIKQVGTDIASSFRERRGTVQDAKAAQSRGEQGGLSTLFQTAGQGAGLVSDVFESIIKGGIKTTLTQNTEDSVKKGISKVVEPVVNSDIIKSVITKYNSLDEESKRNLDSVLNIGSLALDVATLGVGKKAVDTGVKTSLKLASKASGTTADLSKKVGSKVTDTIENIGKKFSEPEIPEAAKTSLNPKKALTGSDQDMLVSVNGKMKKLSDATPDEVDRIQISTQKSFDKFTEQAKKFSKDRSVTGGSPVEIVGNRVDKALDFADKKRQRIGSQMGEIELKYADEVVPIGQKTVDNFVETIKSFDNPKYGVDTADSRIVQKLVKDFDALEKGGASVRERLDFVRSWDNYINDSKDTFGKFKENATVNTRIQNAIRQLKEETVEAVASKDRVYRNLRSQYRTYKQLDEIGDTLLGKDGALGQRIKGAATVKRAIQSNSDAGARQFLIKLRELTGYDAIKEGDVALSAMEGIGDYQGLSLLNIVREGKSGMVNKILQYTQDKIIGDNEQRIKRYIKN
jgi:hypothetical protein